MIDVHTKLVESTVNKNFYDGIKGNSGTEKVRMEVKLPEKLRDALDQKAEDCEDYSSRSELVREALRNTVEGGSE